MSSKLIKCPKCHRGLGFSHVDQTLVLTDTSTDGYLFRICWSIHSPIDCPKCGTTLDANYLKSELEEKGAASHGAALLSALNEGRFNPVSAKSAANKRWHGDENERRDRKPAQPA